MGAAAAVSVIATALITAVLVAVVAHRLNAPVDLMGTVWRAERGIRVPDTQMYMRPTLSFRAGGVVRLGAEVGSSEYGASWKALDGAEADLRWRGLSRSTFALLPPTEIPGLAAIPDLSASQSMRIPAIIGLIIDLEGPSRFVLSAEPFSKDRIVFLK
eukprot:tig00000492_g1444.t1